MPAVTMMDGGSWIVPSVGGKPFLRKPPLAQWCMAASMRSIRAQCVGRTPAERPERPRARRSDDPEHARLADSRAIALCCSRNDDAVCDVREMAASRSWRPYMSASVGSR
jgi:hypothetical protein